MSLKRWHRKYISELYKSAVADHPLFYSGYSPRVLPGRPICRGVVHADVPEQELRGMAVHKHPDPAGNCCTFHNGRWTDGRGVD